MQTTAEHPQSFVSNWIESLRHVSRDRIYAVLMIMPSIILLAIFVYGFIGQSFLWSLTDWAGLEKNPDRQYLGDFPHLDNYETLFSASSGMRFRQELVNTFFFTAFFLIGCLGLGFVLAVLLDQNIKGEAIFRTIFLFPMALSFAVTGTVWRWLLDPKGGINVLPTIVGADAFEFRWLNNRQAYTFNWHEVPVLTIVIILGVFGLLLSQYIRRKRYLTAVFVGIPMLLMFAWMVSDWLSWGDNGGAMHGKFNWQNVPKYLVASLLIGLLLYIISLLWHGKRRGALMWAVPTGLLLIWFAAGGPDSFPTTARKEDYGFNIALIGIILAAMWQMSGYTMAMYLAGIRGIPEELREAARVDGCNEWQVYTKIVLPMLRPITLSAAIVLGHISLKIFDLIFAIVGIDHWPVSVPGVQVYYTMFRSNKFAVGSSIATVLLIMVASVIVPYLITALRSEHEV
jgi:glucose/mannose transport system permease protein